MFEPDVLVSPVFGEEDIESDIMQSSIDNTIIDNEESEC